MARRLYPSRFLSARVEIAVAAGLQPGGSAGLKARGYVFLCLALTLVTWIAGAFAPRVFASVVIGPS